MLQSFKKYRIYKKLSDVVIGINRYDDYNYLKSNLGSGTGYK